MFDDVDERRKRRRKTKTKTKDENVDRKRTEEGKKNLNQNKCALVPKFIINFTTLTNSTLGATSNEPILFCNFHINKL